MTADELDTLDALAIAPVAVLVTPKKPLGKHAVLIREDGSFLMSEGAECEALYKHSDCKAVAEAKAALVAEVKRLRSVVHGAFTEGTLVAGMNEARSRHEWLYSNARKAIGEEG